MSYESFQTNRSKSDQANNCSSPLYWCLLVVAYPSTYLTHSSRVCSAPLITLQFTWLDAFTGCLQSLAVFSGNWRSLAVVCSQAFNDVYAVRRLWIEFCFALLGGGKMSIANQNTPPPQKSLQPLLTGSIVAQVFLSFFCCHPQLCGS